MNKNSSRNHYLIKKTSTKHLQFTLILLFICVFCSTAKSDYTKKNVVTYIYNNKIDTNGKESITAKQEVLNAMWKYRKSNYSTEEIHTILSDAGEINVTKNTSIPDIQQQKKQITGTVVDTNNEAIIGANIIENGTNNGTISDENGNFSLNVAENATIRVSYIGFLEQEINTAEKTTFNIILLEDTKSLEEVVVVGYGVQKKETMTGAVSNLQTDDLTRSPVSDLSNSLSGKITGVVAQQLNAEPGDDGATLYIRGRSTLNDNSPLILVDGIERDFSQLNPNEIESLTVLKDASATAVYGVRGANGVILVTTKRGKESRPILNYNGYMGIQNPTKTPKFLNAFEYASLFNEATRNDNPGIVDGDLPYQPDDLEKYRTHSNPFTHPDVNWYEECRQKDAIQQRHSISLSGGSQNVNYFVSFGYFDQQGMFKNIDFNKYNLRANLDAMLTPKTKISVDLSGIISQKKHPGVVGSTEDGGIFSTVYYLPANAFPVKNEDGTWASLWGVNPVADIYESGYRKNENNDITTSFILEQELDVITKGLSLKLVGAYDFGTEFWKNWNTPYRSFLYEEEIAPGRKPSLYQGFTKYYVTNFEAHLNWQQSFGNHNIGALALYTQSASYSDWENASREDYSSSAIDQLFAGPRTYMQNNGGAGESGREGFVGRVTYNYAQRYLFEFNFGYNGSENFPKGHRYGFFPAFSAGWRLSEEKFFHSVDFINNLKVRGSYGEVGNDKVGYRRFMYKQPVYYGSNAVFGGSTPIPAQALYFGELANENVTWERAKKANIGFESDWFNSIIKLNFDAFWERRDNILANREQSVPATFGATLPVENIAKVNNKGFEVEISHRNKINDFTYYANFNLTYNRNKIVYIDEPANVVPNRRRTGRPMGQYFGYICEGFYNTQEEIENHPRIEGIEPRLGDLKYKDIDGNNEINADDMTAIGKSSIPENIIGLTLGGEYKNFDFNILLQAATGYDIYQEGDFNASLRWGVGGAKLLLDRWTPDNIGNAKFPALTTERETYQTESSSFWLKDGDYLRVKNIELGYTLPKGLLSKLGVNRCRVYLAGENVLTFDSLDYFDPESTNGSGWFYPMQKIYTVGLNVTF